MALFRATDEIRGTASGVLATQQCTTPSTTKVGSLRAGARLVSNHSPCAMSAPDRKGPKPVDRPILSNDASYVITGRKNRPHTDGS